MRRAIAATANSIVRYIKTTVLPEQQRTQRPIIYFVDFFTIVHLIPLALAMSQIPRTKCEPLVSLSYGCCPLTDCAAVSLGDTLF